MSRKSVPVRGIELRRDINLNSALHSKGTSKNKQMTKKIRKNLKDKNKLYISTKQ